MFVPFEIVHAAGVQCRCRAVSPGRVDVEFEVDAVRPDAGRPRAAAGQRSASAAADRAARGDGEGLADLASARRGGLSGRETDSKSDKARVATRATIAPYRGRRVWHPALKPPVIVNVDPLHVAAVRRRIGVADVQARTARAPQLSQPVNDRPIQRWRRAVLRMAGQRRANLDASPVTVAQGAIQPPARLDGVAATEAVLHREVDVWPDIGPGSRRIPHGVVHRDRAGRGCRSERALVRGHVVSRSARAPGASWPAIRSPFQEEARKSRYTDCTRRPRLPTSDQSPRQSASSQPSTAQIRCALPIVAEKTEFLPASSSYSSHSRLPAKEK